MWLIKLLAGSLVLFSSTMIGFSVAKNYRERPRQLRQLQSALQSLATDISFGVTPLPEAFVHLARTTPRPIADLFKTAASTLAAPGVTAEQAWVQGIEAIEASSALLAQDLSILSHLSTVLGLSDRQDQERHLSLAVQQLQREELKAEEDRNRNERMWRYLGVLTGLLLVIVLV